MPPYGPPPRPSPARVAEIQAMLAAAKEKNAPIDKLTQQILAQNTTDKWSGEGFGSAQANAKNMAEILNGIGITDINQFGQIPIYQNLEVMYKVGNYYGTPIGDGKNINVLVPGRYGFDWSTIPIEKATKVYGTFTEDGFYPVDSANVKIVNGNPVIQTGQAYGNKITGQTVPSTYGERQTGNAWGGTFAGSGNTGYRVQFAPDGTPVFYTTGASSNSLANILGDNPLLNIAGNLAAATFGGPAGVAALQLAQGKDVEDAAKAALTSYVGGQIAGGINPEISSALGGGTAGNVAANAITSGTMAELQGGNFLQGAIQGAVSGGINEAKSNLAENYLNSVEPGIPYDTATLPTELDVIAAAPELVPAPVIDTSFTPDYSMSTGVPIVPDMGAQGIQVPTINEVIDVVNQPVDYSLPIPDAGLGLVMPTAPNIDSMGGGQGIVIPVDGGVITESGFIPDQYVPVLGSPESFINQPAPNVEVNISELPAEQPKDISKELALLDIAKALAPVAAGALTANAVVNAISNDGFTGYPILPIPTDWKSPEYNMAFTPSAPIDFGSRDLLQGTQWANPAATPRQMDYSLSDVINTLNYQSVPFVQQQMQPVSQQLTVPDILQQFQTKPTVGINDIIGGLNGRQVSISDIISGIQSQYGQKVAS